MADERKLFHIMFGNAQVFLRLLEKISKLCDSTELVPKSANKFQILARPPSTDGSAAWVRLEMECTYLCFRRDGTSLYFDLSAWIKGIRESLVEEQDADAVLSIWKSPPSCALYAYIRGEARTWTVSLKNSEIKNSSICPSIENFQLSVKVTMTALQFRNFVNQFSMTRQYVSNAELHISSAVIRWHAPWENELYNAEEYSIEGLEANTWFRFRLRWDLRVFNWLHSASLEFQILEWSFYTDVNGLKMYQFGFLNDGQTYHMDFLEMELDPFTLWDQEELDAD